MNIQDKNTGGNAAVAALKRAAQMTNPSYSICELYILLEQSSRPGGMSAISRFMSELEAVEAIRAEELTSCR